MDNPQVVGNRFELGHLIGEGGVGRVYRGLDTQTGEPVAIKLLRPEIILELPELVERFRREGEVLRELNHPNIVTVLTTFEEADQHYIIMEYVGGGSLADLLRNQPQLSLKRALAIALEVADALTRAHHLNIIHRDIKPGNILLAKDGTPRLTDFGLAHIEHYPPITVVGEVVGTFQYLSPEGCNRQTLDERTDIWSFGVVLFEMLAGERPFEGGGYPGGIVGAILNQPVPSLAGFRDDVPPALDELIGQMLAKNPGSRLASMRLVGADLEAIIRGTERPPLVSSDPRLATSFPPRRDLPAQAPLAQERRDVVKASSVEAQPTLQTKLYIPPPRPDFVPRPRLIERLNEAPRSGRKLTLVSAPAGFGKTTLVSDWVNQKAEGGGIKDEAALVLHPSKVAWLSLDEGDNDSTRFLAYFIAALRTIEADIGKGVLSALQSPQPPATEAVLTSLLNEITTLPDDFILVLDDYHVIQAQPVDDALTFLLEHLPPKMHLVIATRDDPPLPLARLRARGQLTELRATDLRFTSSEAAEFLNEVMGLNLSAEDVAALETRTEGWIAGLQLAAISMQGHKDATSFIKSFTGSHRFILDYLIEEVLEQQSESVQTFLLQTAVLDRLTGSLCDAVCSVGTATGQDNGQATLEMLEHANLFIVPLDNERRWYRYHHLFADLLRQRLKQTQSEQLPILHRRASEWYEQNGFVDEAIEHALRSKNFERAADMIEDQFGDNYERVSQTILQRWLAEIPEKFVLSKPQLCILQAWTFFTTGQLGAADQSLRAAEKMLDPSTDQAFVASLDERQLPDTDRRKLIGRVAAIRSFLVSFSGDIPGTIRYARQALEYLPKQELQWRSTVLVALGDAYANQGQMEAAHKTRSDALAAGKASGDPYLLMIVNLRLAEILRQQGKLQQVIDICERQLRSADENRISERTIAGWSFGIWGEVLAELNDLDRATDQAKKGVKLAAHGSDLLYEVMSNLCLVRVLFSCGDLNGAEEAIQSMENTAREYDIPLWALLQFSAWRARIWLARGKLELVSEWVGERALDPEGEPTYLHEVEYIVFARILIAQGKLDEATRLLQQLLEAAEAGGRTAKVIEILMLQTLAAHSGGDIDQAMSTLEQALTLAEPGGFVRTFVDEGPPMALLLDEALNRGIASDYVSRLLAAFPAAEAEQVAPSQTQAPESDLIEPLSEREIEVLQLIAEGLTNQEIANRLFLSLNTVKVHTRNIYGKLDAHHRTEAVAKARALGILHPT